MVYVQIDNGVVIGKSYQPRAGYTEAPDGATVGYLYDSATGEFTAPDTSPTDQELRDRLANEARAVFAQHDAQQQEYERDVRLGNTPEADGYTYTALDGTAHTGRASLDRWGDDLRAIIREANAGTLDPAETLPKPPS